MFSRDCLAGGSPAVAPAALDPAQVAGAVDRYLALREFRARLYGCLTARADALFELCDAILCADHAVTSLVQLSLEPEFRRGHGALYDALAAGRVDDERLFSLLTEVLPPLVDGPEGRAWIAGHDVTDRRLLDRALSRGPAAGAPRGRGPPPRQGGWPGRPPPGWAGPPAGSVFYQDAVTWDGKAGRPARRGPEVHCLEPEALAAAAAGRGSRGRKTPLPPPPGPDETLVLPDTPLYGTVRAEAWHDVHPHVQPLPARPPAADLRRPWEKHPDPDRPLSPGRVRRGFRNIHRDLGTPARVPKPSRPGPGRPKGSTKGAALRHLLPGEANMPRTPKQLLTREKVKS